MPMILVLDDYVPQVAEGKAAVNFFGHRQQMGRVADGNVVPRRGLFPGIEPEPFRILARFFFVPDYVASRIVDQNSPCSGRIVCFGTEKASRDQKILEAALGWGMIPVNKLSPT